jgi:hypothetical protein
MAQARFYSSTTRATTTTVDPGTSGTTLTVADSTVFSSLDGSFPWTALINWGASDQEVVNVTARPTSTTLTIVRGQDGTTGQAHATGATVNHGVSARDFNESGAHVGSTTGAHGANGTLVGSNDIAPGVMAPSRWTLYGHSYFARAIGTVWTTGRTDAYLRMMLDIEFTNWANYAVAGSNLIIQGVWTGGWARVMQTLTRIPPAGTNIHGSPYFSDGGGAIFAWGINDIGGVSGTQTALRLAFQHALRAVISRARSSVVFEDNSTVGGLPTYGSGFAQVTASQDYSSGSTVRQATSTTNANLTITLPADYKGEPVAIQFSAMPGALGGNVSFGGTAGVTGTLALTGVAPATPNSHLPVVKRITNLTATAASKTITVTVTSVDAGGLVIFDCWWLESLIPAPVIVCNVARLLTAGYGGYGNGIGDTDVASLNTAITSVVGEFDGMVQIADIDSALNKDSTRFAADGLHPNEDGARYCARAIQTAIKRLVPTDPAAPEVSTAQSAPQAGPARIPRLGGGIQYHTIAASASTTGAAPAAGTIYAMPFVVTEGREMFNKFAFRVSTGGTAGSIRIALFDDPGWTGYPQNLVDEPTVGGAMSTTTTTGMKTSSAGLFTWALDPGLWWILWLQVTQGASEFYDMLVGPDMTGVMPWVNPTTLASYTTPIAYQLTGQGTGGFFGNFPAGATVAATCPKLALLKM